MARHTSNIFSIRLRLARKAKNLSQERLGILAGIEESSASARMNQYETGKHVPDFLMASKIADVLDVPVAYFYTDNDLMAKMILKIHLMSHQQRLEILKFIDMLDQHTS
ncbi:helix-turn-helix domain-containing protein [Acinetobacter sp. YH01022]|jgi:transcriptional regulator with XRE-family HTH domain|uniref:helix-turn-helix domain-containing protein n=1 Tax=Acinetobacter sp. YH01022 TaxID=2601036 RepID=UPI0015D24AD1|nr:helix-turn-helix transcriptional regulator [Acinetobacter sp. YH01022]